MKTTRGSHRAKRRNGEEGAVAIMIAAAMVALCLAAAMVLDFGIVRFDKQANKAAADAATAAGLRALDADHDDADPDALAHAGKPHPFQGACEALNYMKANSPEITSASLSSEWKTGAGNVISDPCTGVTPEWDTLCDPADSATWARYTGTVTKSDDTTMVITIESAYQLADPDGGDPERNGCDQLAVTVQETQNPGLGSLATDEDITTTVRTVGRVQIDNDPPTPVALLLLERNDCSVLQNNSNNTTITVRGYGDKPGLIHSDSLGNGSGCSSRNIFYSQRTDGIVVEQSEEDDIPGIVTVRALSGEDGAVPAEAEIDPTRIVIEPDGRQPEGRELVTRSVVDDMYLAHVEAVRDEANDVVDMTPAERAIDGWTEVGCDPPPAATAGTGKFWVDCATFKVGDFPEATEVVFNGTVNADNVQLPKAKEVYITGTANNNGDALRFTDFRMNNEGASATSCDGVTNTPARLVIGGGEMTNAGNSAELQLCNTAVLLMGAEEDACLGSDYDASPGCTNGILNISTGAIIWTAPNSVQGTDARTDADFAELEDLALWTEASNSGFSLSGNLTLGGVFMAPNAELFKISGGGTMDVEDSQFIVRKFEVTGDGEFSMRPDPYNSVSVPLMSGFSLVR